MTGLSKSDSDISKILVVEECDGKVLTKKDKEKTRKAAQKKKKESESTNVKKKTLGSVVATMLKAKMIEDTRLEEVERTEHTRLQALEDERVRLYEEDIKAKDDAKERKKQYKLDKIAAEREAGTYLTHTQKVKKNEQERKVKEMVELYGIDFNALKAGPKKKSKKYAIENKKAAYETKVSQEMSIKEAATTAKESATTVRERDDVKDVWDDSSDEEEYSETVSVNEETDAVVVYAETTVTVVVSDETAQETVEVFKSKKGTGGGAKFEDVVAKEAVADTIFDRSAATEYGGVDFGQMRSPIICVLGHVDVGKTKILDKIRRTRVQDNEANGITQQIGSSYLPGDVVKQKYSKVLKSDQLDLQIPGILIMDTPGHESFSNLRSRGSKLCNMAVLVIDIMHGLEQQTVESIDLLRSRKTPFIIALNKVDNLNQWKSTPDGAIKPCLNKQTSNTLQHFESLSKRVILQINELGLNCALYYDNKDMRSTINIVPTSAHTGEGIPDLLFLLCMLTQNLLSKQLTYTGKLDATVLEVKKIDGYGTTIDVILTDGALHEGDIIVCSGLEGPIITTVRSLLMPEPLKELRVKNSYRKFASVPATNGVKVVAVGLDKAVAGLPILVARDMAHALELSEEVDDMLEDTLAAMKTTNSGVLVKASTLGSLEALLVFLKGEKIPVSQLGIGPIHEKDVKRASIQLKRDPKFAIILCFDCVVEREAQREADRLGIKIFTADIIYHLFDKFNVHIKTETERLRARFSAIATFPCKLDIIPECIFNKRDPIVIGVRVKEGILKVGTPICVYGKGEQQPPIHKGGKLFCHLGVVQSIQVDKEEMETAKVGQEVCIKIDPAGQDKKALGRHFDESDTLISSIRRESIDAVKNYFRDDLSKADWKLMKELKDMFDII